MAGSVVDGSGGGGEMSAGELAAKLGRASGPLLVDVRQPEEFAAWAIAGARNIPLAELGAWMASMDPTREVVVVCASGARSGRAVEALRAAGIPARNLCGGMMAWASLYESVWMDLGSVGVVQLRRRGKGCLSYVAGAGGEAVVVDPSLDVAHYRNAAAARGWRITRVFDTHLHADHVSGARLLAASTGAFLHLPAADSFAYPHEPVAGGERFFLGPRGASVGVMAVPGHTRGSILLSVAGRAILSGDTLFVDGVGRPDLADRAEEDAGALYRSLRALTAASDGTTLVMPAHYRESLRVLPGIPIARSLAEVCSSVPQLDWDESAFVSWASTRSAPRPPSHVEIVRVNRGELELDVDTCRRLELGPNRCAA